MAENFKKTIAYVTPICANPGLKFCFIFVFYLPMYCARGGGHLGIFWVGMCRPGLQIGTPF